MLYSLKSGKFFFIPFIACIVLHPFGHNMCDSQEERAKNYFIPRSGQNLCAPLAKGDFFLPARSRIHCAVICSGLPCCVYHSYTITSRLCYIHIHTPVNFTNESDCKFMEVCTNMSSFCRCRIIYSIYCIYYLLIILLLTCCRIRP